LAAHGRIGGDMLRVVTSTLVVLALTPAAAPAQSVEEFYKANRITIMLGQPPGGSYDLYARLVANHMAKHIPGNPTIIVEHRPGGGGVRATQFFYTQSPRDGSVIGLFSETIAHTQLLQPDIGKWNVAEMRYIGSFSPVNAAFVARKEAPAKAPAEMREKSMNVGCTGRTSQSYQSPALLKNLGGFKFNLICGYPGSKDYVLALVRGEVDMVSSAWNQWRAGHRAEIADGSLIPVIQTGLKRHKELPNVPLMQEVVDDPEIKKVIEFASAGSDIGRALIAPPQVPADRLAALRSAFEKLVKDPDFLKDAERVRAEIDPEPGTEMDKVVQQILKTPPDIVQKAAKAME
jgi:tripartite-type tricarboxylate transporter receptor subunit TctC